MINDTWMLKKGSFSPRFHRHVIRCVEHACPQGAVTVITWKTRSFHPTLVQRWASVVDGGPTLNQHCAYASLFSDTSCVIRVIAFNMKGSGLEPYSSSLQEQITQQFHGQRGFRDYCNEKM